MGKRKNISQMQKKLLMDSPELRAKYKFSGVAAIIFAIVTIILLLGIIGFVFPSENVSVEAFLAGMRSLIAIFLWGIAIVLCVGTILLWVFSGGNFTIFGWELFAIGLGVAVDKENTFFKVVLVVICAIAVLFSLIALLNAIKQYKISKRAFSIVSLSFSVVAIAAAIIMLIFLLVTIF